LYPIVVYGIRSSKFIQPNKYEDVPNYGDIFDYLYQKYNINLLLSPEVLKKENLERLEDSRIGLDVNYVSKF
jgi:hypothetical protein